jgi:hypothetical protein
MKKFKIISNSFGIVGSSALLVVSLYTILGLLLNFWNESTLNASVALMASIMIGTLALVVLDLLIKLSKEL